MSAAVVHQQQFTLSTPGRGTIAIDAEVAKVVASSGCAQGVAVVFIKHTSASLILCENADPQVRRDLEAWLARAVPVGDSLYGHVAEGPDDMPAHVRATLTASSLSIPVSAGRLALGTWQGLYLYEHRSAAHRRTVHVTVLGADRA